MYSYEERIRAIKFYINCGYNAAYEKANAFYEKEYRDRQKICKEARKKVFAQIDKKGLDCSGFVSWVYWSVAAPDHPVCPCGMSTGTFPGSLGLERISASELKPGDIGLEAPPGAKSNHIGFFAGYDESGRAKWVHCSGSSGVTCNTTNGFRIYYRLF